MFLFLLQRRKYQGGYIALMATIVISAILLVLSVEGSLAGFHARFNILGTEAKEQAAALAEGCADQALSAVVTDPSYTGDATTTTSGGTCYVFPVAYNVPATGIVTIRAQASVRTSFANVEMQMSMSQIHIDTAKSTSTKGTLVVATVVINDGSGTSTPNMFLMQVTGIAVSTTTFSGVTGGQIVTLNPGAYSVAGAPRAGYLPSQSSTCTGTIAAGSIMFCTITYNDITTTLTVLASTQNDAGGLFDTSDARVAVDGVSVTLGQAVAVLPGTHTVSALTPAGYTVSSWGTACAATGNVTLAAGNTKTCSITFADNPPLLPTCAEAVVMLDRTSNFSTTDRAHEKAAASALADLYTSAASATKLAFGSMGGIDGTTASIPTSGQLSTTLASQKSAITALTDSASTGGSDLSMNIKVAQTELSSSRHDAGKARAMVIVSNGVPTLPLTSATTSPSYAALIAADLAKQAGIAVYTVHFGTNPGPYYGKNILANLASGKEEVPGHEPASLADAVGVVTGNTGLVSPTAQIAVAGGDDNGFEINPERAFTDASPNSAAGAAQNSDGAGDLHTYQGYPFTIPPGATIQGIETRMDWWLDSIVGASSIGIELSWDGGVSWTAIKTDTTKSILLTNSRTLGSATDLWGHAWTPADLTMTHFKVRLTMNSTVLTRDFYLDWIPVIVYYSVAAENADNDNFFIAAASSDVKSILDYIGQQICPSARFIFPLTPPTTATIKVITTVINNNGGTLKPSAISVAVTPTTALPHAFSGTATGVDSVLPAGSYSIKSTVTPVGYREEVGDACVGSIPVGENRLCVLTYDDIPPAPAAPDLSIHLNQWKELPVLP